MSLLAFPQPDQPQDEALPAGFPELPAVMSPKTLAELLEVTPKSLERWRDAKTGPAYLKLPGSSLIRYTRDDVVAWLAAARVEVTE
ncbi:helix-turn-helix transcriptional regulator [Microbacterium imperiale]|uniref:Helix-turn-helix domain-containing protein n=1 Tax=Microbacterium imperiale TaxID=33884 RepID=A0A9W6HDT6_9MICO|nr:helix-turn-helix domain-containing protein [Microbacterium imperiale]MBP2420018.1 hypothetical protein [Microbacterium imperiale]MDS0198118.1 helix-turn-helix domain-containing protein [Microbacterium imperiale]BFE40360.1 hypothetical protein GCM10017544_13160 [Microbacterium imperiale]GLJ78664.1 hypothetical protein GCM10017586_03460 [Microbacterium imperiale]